MGLYDKKSAFDFGFDVKSFKRPAMAIIAIILVVLLFFALSSVFKPKALQVSVKDNPLVVDAEQNNFTVLTAEVTNVTEKEAKNVQVTVQAVADSQYRPLLVGVNSIESKTIPVLGKGESREIEFIIRPNPAVELTPGNYKITVSVLVNSLLEKQEVTLLVQRK